MVVGIFPDVKLPPWWAVPVKRSGKPPYLVILPTAKVLAPTNVKPPTVQTLPPYCITALFWFYRFRQKSTAIPRYRQKVPPTLNNAKRVPPTLDTAQKVPPTLDTAQKVPSTLDIAQKEPPILDTAQKVPRTLDTAQKVPAFLFVFILCSLFFLVLRVPFRLRTCGQRRPRTCPYTYPHTCPHHAQQNYERFRGESQCYQ